MALAVTSWARSARFASGSFGTGFGTHTTREGSSNRCRKNAVKLSPISRATGPHTFPQNTSSATVADARFAVSSSPNVTFGTP